MSTPSENLSKRKLLNKHSERFKRQKTPAQDAPICSSTVGEPSSSSYVFQEASTSTSITSQDALLSAFLTTLEDPPILDSDSESDNEIVENHTNRDLDFAIDRNCGESSFQPTLSEQLSSWAITHNISHLAISQLLGILQGQNLNVPKDARTLLKTPRKTGYHLEKVQPGVYYHFGFLSSLKILIDKLPKNSKTNTLQVCINVDGLPLAKSSGSSLWPIMLNLITNKNVVEIMGIYHGNEKPNNSNEYLSRFVDEAVPLINNGFLYNGKEYNVKIAAFICDVPAKSFIKCIRGHSGYMSCTKCDIKGDYKNGRVCFPDSDTISFQLRTDLSFRNKIQEEHHSGTSILEQLPEINMIDSFPLDYMHLACLGVMKKLIVNLWLSGKPPYKLSVHQTNQISLRNLEFKNQVPEEFSRKPRSLLESKRWKATEFRLFLFYTGAVALKGNVDENIYNNFVCLQVAFILLSLNKNIDYANELLKYFVRTFIIIYGSEHVSHNIHSLLHIAADSKIYGSIENVSAFPFENNMLFLKKLIRKGDQPVQQIVNRVYERKHSIRSVQSTLQFPHLESQHFQGPILPNLVTASIKQFKKIVFDTFVLSIADANNCCILKDNSIINIKNIIEINDDIQIIGTKYNVLKDFFQVPCNSSELNIFKVSQESSLQIWSISDILKKCVKLKLQNEFIIYPLLHMGSYKFLQPIYRTCISKVTHIKKVHSPEIAKNHVFQTNNNDYWIVRLS